MLAFLLLLLHLSFRCFDGLRRCGYLLACGVRSVAFEAYKMVRDDGISIFLGCGESRMARLCWFVEGWEGGGSQGRCGLGCVCIDAGIGGGYLF
jgi:hypothetical protein